MKSNRKFLSFFNYNLTVKYLPLLLFISFFSYGYSRDNNYKNNILYKTFNKYDYFFSFSEEVNLLTETIYKNYHDYEVKEKSFTNFFYDKNFLSKINSFTNKTNLNLEYNNDNDAKLFTRNKFNIFYLEYILKDNNAYVVPFYNLCLNLFKNLFDKDKNFYLYFHSLLFVFFYRKICHYISKFLFDKILHYIKDIIYNHNFFLDYFNSDAENNKLDLKLIINKFINLFDKNDDLFVFKILKQISKDDSFVNIDLLEDLLNSFLFEVNSKKNLISDNFFKSIYFKKIRDFFNIFIAKELNLEQFSLEKILSKNFNIFNFLMNYKDFFLNIYLNLDGEIFYKISNLFFRFSYFENVQLKNNVFAIRPICKDLDKVFMPLNVVFDIPSFLNYLVLYFFYDIDFFKQIIENIIEIFDQGRVRSFFLQTLQIYLDKYFYQIFFNAKYRFQEICQKYFSQSFITNVFSDCEQVKIILFFILNFIYDFNLVNFEVKKDICLDYEYYCDIKNKEINYKKNFFYNNIIKKFNLFCKKYKFRDFNFDQLNNNIKNDFNFNNYLSFNNNNYNVFYIIFNDLINLLVSNENSVHLKSLDDNCNYKDVCLLIVIICICFYIICFLDIYSFILFFFIIVILLLNFISFQFFHSNFFIDFLSSLIFCIFKADKSNNSFNLYSYILKEIININNKLKFSNFISLLFYLYYFFIKNNKKYTDNTIFYKIFIAIFFLFFFYINIEIFFKIFQIVFLIFFKFLFLFNFFWLIIILLCIRFYYFHYTVIKKSKSNDDDNNDASLRKIDVFYILNNNFIFTLLIIFCFKNYMYYFSNNFNKYNINFFIVYIFLLIPFLIFLYFYGIFWINNFYTLFLDKKKDEEENKNCNNNYIVFFITLFIFISCYIIYMFYINSKYYSVTSLITFFKVVLNMTNN